MSEAPPGGAGDAGLSVNFSPVDPVLSDGVAVSVGTALASASGGAGDSTGVPDSAGPAVPAAGPGEEGPVDSGAGSASGECSSVMAAQGFRPVG
jgi:hypothetical protein